MARGKALARQGKSLCVGGIESSRGRKDADRDWLLRDRGIRVGPVAAFTKAPFRAPLFRAPRTACPGSRGRKD